MIGFDNYKRTNFIMKILDLYYTIFNTRTKRIVFNSCSAFVVGIGIASAGLFITRNLHIQNGVGGLETSAVPEFNEADFEETVIAETELSENLAEAVIDDIENLEVVPTGEDSLDMAAAVLEQDMGSEASLELYYQTYRVKPGDMIGFIAQEFNVTSDTIVSVNSIKAARNILPGQFLKIPSMPGILYTVRTGSETIETIAEKYEVSAEKCARVNSIDRNAKLVAGKTLFVPDAQLDWVTRQEINGDLFIKPLRSRYWLSSYFGWRSSPFSGKRSYHSGVDMAAPSGTNVYAALAGKVTTVSYNSVYGNYIIVTHHSGYKTLYAHLSATLVSVGKYVDTNTRIGKVGNTGMSTGPHLHFTVFKQGKAVNPMALWK